MSANNRLHALQTALASRGVRDVKFFLNFAPEAALSAVSADVADVLQAIHDGNVKQFQGFGDATEA